MCPPSWHSAGCRADRWSKGSPLEGTVAGDPCDPIQGVRASLAPLANAGARGSAGPLLPALLDEAPDEVLGVGFEHVVDLVEQGVDVLGQLLVALGDVTGGLDLDLVDFAFALLWTALVMRRHRATPSL